MSPPGARKTTDALTCERIQREVATVVAGEPEVLAVYLFGSRATGEEHRASDVDLAVLFDRPRSLEDVVRLECRLEDALSIAVDLVDLRKASAFLALAAIRGERIHCRDSRRCDEFDLYVLRRAGDLAPFEKERRRVLLDPERHRKPPGSPPP